MGSVFSNGVPGSLSVFRNPNLSASGAQYSGYNFTPPVTPSGTQSCFTISDNGTTRKYWYSPDGITRLLILATPDNDFLIPDHVGVYLDSAFSSQSVAMALLSFTIVTESI